MLAEQLAGSNGGPGWFIIGLGVAFVLFVIWAFWIAVGFRNGRGSNPGSSSRGPFS